MRSVPDSNRGLRRSQDFQNFMFSAGKSAFDRQLFKFGICLQHKCHPLLRRHMPYCLIILTAIKI